MTANQDPRQPRPRWGRGDIPPLPPPHLRQETWQNCAEALHELRGWAERRTVETIDWYLRDKRLRRVASRLLRAAAVLAAIAGGIIPLLPTTGAASNVGYVLLAVAAGCVAFDHFFGLSAGWMRNMTTVQTLQSRLAAFHLAWAEWQAAEAGVLTSHPQPDEPGGVRRALDLISGLMNDVSALTEAETAQWVSHFTSSIAALRRQATATGPESVEPRLGPSTNANIPPDQR